MKRARNFAGDIQAFHANVLVIPGGCHIWTGGHASNGRGVCQVNGKSKLVHRFALELALGHDLLEGECALHGPCNRPDCVNPDHLRAGSKQDNSDDMVAQNRSFNGDSRKVVTIKEVVAMADLRAQGKSWYFIAKTFGRAQQMVKRNIEAYLAEKKKPVASVTVMPSPLTVQPIPMAA